MGRYLFLLAWLLGTFGVHASESPVRYQEQVKPLLDQHCVECHSGWFPKGGLRLDSLANIREGGKNGAAILPGQPTKGWLINLVVPRGGAPSAMPPGPAQLKPEEVELLREWIRQGAR
ncbi:c-type cytochrome domain-containing protein [Motiliproteus sp. SC1-56]|uniref:c-type cytochrome domain-containing protein n=1 Tax=Motiliproteus sp. SC1-56 TaxID=2799565 RepID=UPI001A9058B3|nr:c-type cytochrome domain-containing protein [Motiliproteus sp. SC1-56]